MSKPKRAATRARAGRVPARSTVPNGAPRREIHALPARLANDGRSGEAGVALEPPPNFQARAPVRRRRMSSKLLCLCVSVAGFALTAFAQAPQQPKSDDMRVRINYMNVCSPSDADKKEIVSALERIPTAPSFGPEFEIARGRSAAPDAPIASWVRVRREFPAGAPLTNAQYSFSLDAKDIIETVVLRWREPKDVMQVSIEDSVSAVASPATVVSTDTPASRIRIERFGKSSLGLSRCTEADQTAYESVFAAANRVMSLYRTALGVRQSVPQELARLGVDRSQPAKSQKPGVKSQ